MKKICCILLVCLVCISAVFSSAVTGLHVRIINYTSGELTIRYELRKERSQKPIYMVRQVIDGLEVMVDDWLLDGELCVRPQQYRYGTFFPEIVKVWPIINRAIEGSRLKEKYHTLYAIPFMTLMKQIYKTFSVSRKDGKEVFTLDTLGDVVIKKRISEHDDPVPSIDYYIEIFDYDLVGRPASEW